jgi:hypothetical protein
MRIVRCEFSGGPAHGERVFLVRPPEFQVMAAAFVVQAEEGGERHQYELAGPDPRSGLMYAHAGAFVPDDDGGDAPGEWPDRSVEVVAPDGTAARKTRLFFDGGPADGLFLFLVFPPALILGDVLFDMAFEGESGRTHVYERIAAWQDSSDLAPDAIVFRHSEIKSAPAAGGLNRAGPPVPP